MSGVRSAEFPHPNVWIRFKALDCDSDKLVEYRVQDMVEEDFDRVFEFMTKFFFYDEPMNASVNLNDDPDAQADIKIVWRSVLNQKLSLVCYKDGSDEVVGCNFLCLKKINDPEEKVAFKSQKLQSIIDGMKYAANQFDPFQHYEVDSFVSALGLSVNPKFRGRGVAVQILKARIPLCKAYNIKLTANTFTGMVSQACARKAGFETNFEITYEELGKQGYSFPKIKESSIVMMSLPIN